jgi:diguanylate cyclase (GGDEF)-like protein/PAS domain S-box-containing protein
MLGFGLVGYVPSAISAVGQGDTAILVCLSAGYMAVIAVTLVKNLSYRARVQLVCVFIFGIGVAVFLQSHLVGSGRLWFLCSISLAALLIGFRLAAIFGVLSVAVILAKAWAQGFGIQLPNAAGSEVWGLITATFVLVSLIIGVSGHLLMSGLHRTLRRERSLLREAAQANQELRRSRERLELVIRGTDVGVWDWHIPSGQTTFNERWAELAGYSLQELQPTDIRTWRNLCHPDDLRESQELLRSHFEGEIEQYECECRMQHREGGWIWVLDRGKVVERNEAGEPVRMAGTHLDITERKQAVERYKSLSAMVEQSTESFILMDSGFRITYMNGAAQELFGWGLEEVRGYGFEVLAPEDETAEERGDIREKAGAGDVYSGELACRRKDGATLICSARVSPIRDRRDAVTGFMAGMRDITQEKRNRERLAYLSFHDPLTGLSNRNYFEERLHLLQGRNAAPLGIVVCDVDGLKLVNDTRGHEHGDRQLREAAGLIRDVFHASDTVARVGGDEFAVLVSGVGPEELDRMVARLRKAVETHNAQDGSLSLSIAVGKAMSWETPANTRALFSEADNTMHKEKLHREQSMHHLLVQAMSKALEARDFITEGHCSRLENLVTALAESLRLPDDRLNDLVLLAKFHDLGKVGIADSILMKQGPLTREEVREMRKHCEIGSQIAKAIPSLSHISELILKHHEWWNGQGYPTGLAGEDIPLECRILAIADAFDAMTSDRPYRRAESPEEAAAELKRCAGSQFDPFLVERFISVLGQTGQIRPAREQDAPLPAASDTP